jgi:hypothetical protein
MLVSSCHDEWLTSSRYILSQTLGSGSHNYPRLSWPECVAVSLAVLDGFHAEDDCGRQDPVPDSNHGKCWEEPPSFGRGHLRTETMRVLDTFLQLLRERPRWRRILTTAEGERLDPVPAALNAGCMEVW